MERESVDVVVYRTPFKVYVSYTYEDGEICDFFVEEVVNLATYESVDPGSPLLGERIARAALKEVEKLEQEVSATCSDDGEYPDDEW